MKFNEKLSFLRKKHGMTQMELAEKLDISRQAVSRWEQGTSEPSTENLVSIGKLFGISVDDLVDESVQLQTESAIQVAVAEKAEKESAEKRRKYGIAKIVGAAIFAAALVRAIYIGLGIGRSTHDVRDSQTNQRNGYQQLYLLVLSLIENALWPIYN